MFIMLFYSLQKLHMVFWTRIFKLNAIPCLEGSAGLTKAGTDYCVAAAAS